MTFRKCLLFCISLITVFILGAMCSYFFLIKSYNSKFETNPFINDEYQESFNSSLDNNDINDYAIQAYNHFLEGNIKIDNYTIDSIIIPTGEPDSRYYTKYAFFDINRDGIYDMHIKTPREYIIFSYDYTNGLYLWNSLSPYIEPLNNGAFMFTRYLFASMKESYCYIIIDNYGNEICQIKFGISDSYDETNNDNNQYWFCDTEVSKEIYESLSSPYMEIGSDMINWIVLCENS